MGEQETPSFEKVTTYLTSKNMMKSDFEDLSLREARCKGAAQKEMGVNNKDKSKLQDQLTSPQEREYILEELPLERSMRCLLERRHQQSTLRRLTLPHPGQIDFSSNDFLSLSTSPVLKTAYIQELSSSNLPIGSGGSRLLDGNSTYAEDLERKIARFHKAPSGLIFNSGFDANAGFFSCVPQPGDIIVYDSLIHASVHDGMRLSRASKSIPFAHNSVHDLRKVLSSCWCQSSTLREGRSHVIIAVEAVYSMDGDLAPLKEIVEVVDSVLGLDAGYIVVDEAHSTGVLGPDGRGLVNDFGLEKKIFARLHTFGKSLACNGAIILGSETLRQYLINYARPLIYTTFISYPSLVAIQASYSLLISGQATSMAAHLNKLIIGLFTLLADASLPGLTIPLTCPNSPIFSIQTSQPKNLAGYLQDRGMMVRAVVPPTVPEGTERVRVCLHAGNTVDQIQALVRALESWAKSRTTEDNAKHKNPAVMEKMSTNSKVVVSSRL